jgi:hypothetical protein
MLWRNNPIDIWLTGETQPQPTEERTMTGEKPATPLRHRDPCADKAAPDEPIFTLRAHDQTAPDTVRAWARVAHESGSPPAKVEEALRIAAAMETWQTHNGAKVPD